MSGEGPIGATNIRAPDERGDQVRIAVISDIHGNLIALDAVAEDVAEQSVDAVWCGGDLAWGGPWAAECIDYVRSEGWITVKGNTDVWITGDPQTIDDDGQRAELKAIAAAHGLTSADARWLLDLPLGHAGPGSTLLVHGTPDSPFTAPLPDAPAEQFKPYEGRAQLVVYGHVHHAFVRRLAPGTIVANPGSVGLPKDGETASYLLIDLEGSELCLRHRRIEFDRTAAIDAARARGDEVGAFFERNLVGTR